MSQLRTVPLPWTTLTTAQSSSDEFHSSGGWMASGNLSNVRAVWELKQTTGNITVTPALEFANAEGDPSPVVVQVGTLTGSKAVHFPNSWQDISSSTASKQIVRPGWVVRNSSGTALSTARVGGKLELVTC